MNRRTFLKQTGAVAAGATALGVGKSKADAHPATRIIDTHVHFYDPSRKEGVSWPPKSSPLYRSVLPKDWAAVALPLGVTEVVVVEASSRLEDNAWVLEMALSEPAIVGFVGHLLPHDTDFEKHLKRFGSNPIFRGVRVNQGDFFKQCDRAEFKAGLKLMSEKGLELDLNISPPMLEAVAKVAGENPALRIVIDHVGSAGDATALSEEWLDGMRAAGKEVNVFCKVSALQEQTKAAGKQFGQAPRESAYYAPILDHCWNCFGEDRLIYGSNWPVSDVGGSYADQFKIVSDYFAAKGAEACEKYFWKNAARAYGLAGAK